VRAHAFFRRRIDRGGELKLVAESRVSTPPMWWDMRLVKHEGLAALRHGIEISRFRRQNRRAWHSDHRHRLQPAACGNSSSTVEIRQAYDEMSFSRVLCCWSVDTPETKGGYGDYSSAVDALANRQAHMNTRYRFVKSQNRVFNKHGDKHSIAMCRSDKVVVAHARLSQELFLGRANSSTQLRRPTLRVLLFLEC
jgi:hypothetical protein